MLAKFKYLKHRLSIFFRTGYWNPKYVFLAILANSDEDNDDEENNCLWNAAVQYYRENDNIYDELYTAIYELKILRKIVREDKNNE